MTRDDFKIMDEMHEFGLRVCYRRYQDNNLNSQMEFNEWRKKQFITNPETFAATGNPL